MRRPGLIVILLTILAVTTGNAQTKCWIEFRDKGISPSRFRPGQPLFESARKELTPACLARRARTLQCDELQTITLADAPVSKQYEQRLQKLGVHVQSASKWCNAVTATLTPEQVHRVSRLPFVASVHPVGRTIELGTPAATASRPLNLPASSHLQVLSADTTCGYNPIIYHYGLATSQLDRINVWPLHAMGFDGSGIKFGILDCGFRWRENPSTRHSKVINEYDYIFHDSITENEAIDTLGQDGHGTNTLSAATGYLPDTLVGPAYNVSIMLAKTEDIRSEHHIEEDNYAAALEDMEALGVDITSSSLGYFTFDPPDASYSYADMNGHTAICTRAAEHAAKLGVLVVTAMGNSGADAANPHVEAPGDADSIISAGALDTTEFIANFSSRGPTYDGRIKPEICAPGVYVWLQSRDGYFFPGNGTSFATPLTSGSSCLILQAHPNATAQQIRQAIMKTGSIASTPDTAYGYGRLNAYAAALELGTIAHVMNGWVDSTTAHVCAGAASKSKISYVILISKGDVDATQHTTLCSLVTDSLIYSCTVPITGNNTKFYYRIKVVDVTNAQTFDPLNGWDSLMLPPPKMAVSEPPNSNWSLTAFPNPSTNDFSVNLQAVGQWQLLDEVGRLVDAGSNNSAADVHIDVSQISAGTYYLRFNARSGEVRSTRVVVKH